MACPDCGSEIDLYEPDSPVTESELYTIVADDTEPNTFNFRAECPDCDWSDTMTLMMRYHWD